MYELPIIVNHLSIINNHFAFAPLHLSRVLYKFAPFMQNKPNFLNTQMNVNKVLTRDYEKKTLGEHGKNKANTNPIQTQYKPNSQKAKMKLTFYLTKDYENERLCRCGQNKPNQTQPVVSLPALSLPVVSLSNQSKCRTDFKGKKPRSDSFRHRATKNLPAIVHLCLFVTPQTPFIASGYSCRTPPQSCPAFFLSRSFVVSSHLRQVCQVRQPPPADWD